MRLSRAQCSWNSTEDEIVKIRINHAHGEREADDALNENINYSCVSIRVCLTDTQHT